MVSSSSYKYGLTILPRQAFLFVWVCGCGGGGGGGGGAGAGCGGGWVLLCVGVCYYVLVCATVGIC